VSNPEDVKALIASGSTDILVHFGDENFLTRYKLFEENLPQWKAQYPKLASVDTRYENQMVLEMTPGTAVPVADAGATDSTAAKTDDAKTAAAAAPASAPAAPAKPLAAAKAPVVKPVTKPLTKAEADKKRIAAELAAARKPPAIKKPSTGQAVTQ